MRMKMAMTTSDLFVGFCTLFCDPSDLTHAESSLEWLHRLGGSYGIDTAAIETELRKSNATEVADKLMQEPTGNLRVRIYGEIGFHISQLASCVYDIETGLDVVEPLSDTMSFLLVLEALEEKYAAAERD